jgi:hypothetical protein
VLVFDEKFKLRCFYFFVESHKIVVRHIALAIPPPPSVVPIGLMIDGIELMVMFKFIFVY